MYQYKDSIEEALSEGRSVEITSIVQSLRIYLGEDVEKVPCERFVNAGLLSTVLSFISYDYRVFQLLRCEALKIVCTLTVCNDSIIKTLIQEGLLRRIKLAMVDTLVLGEEFKLIVLIVGNIAGSSKFAEAASNLASSGVLSNIIVDAHRYYGNHEIVEDLCFLFSNFLRAINYVQNFDFPALVAEMYNCINSVEGPTGKTIADVIWGTAFYLECKRKLKDRVEHLNQLNVIKDLILHFEAGNYRKDLEVPFSRILSSLSYFYEYSRPSFSVSTARVL